MDGPNMPPQPGQPSENQQQVSMSTKTPLDPQPTSSEAAQQTGEQPKNKRTLDQPAPPATPKLTKKDPSIPTLPSSTKSEPQDKHVEKQKAPCLRRFLRFLYNKDKRTFCDRSCLDWGRLLGYGVMYMMFLSTFTMMLLYVSLAIIKNKIKSSSVQFAQFDYMTYNPNSVGLTAVPVAVHDFPLIWYRHGEPEDYEKYLLFLDNLFAKKKQEKKVKREEDNLGPCGRRPYGYGEQPCVFVKINKQWVWNAKPLHHKSPNLETVPPEVKQWVSKDTEKFWLHCQGYHSYDKEHLGAIKYYPDPPGFDASLFPLERTRSSPLVAIQFSNFTLGISLAIECKLWYDNGQVDVSFMLYVTPNNRIVKNFTTVFSHY